MSALDKVGVCAWGAWGWAVREGFLGGVGGGFEGHWGKVLIGQKRRLRG